MATKDTLWEEAVHGAMFLAIQMLALYAAARSPYDAAVYLTACDVLINFYPVILQRYNRFRLAKVIPRRDFIQQKETPYRRAQDRL